MIPSKEDIMIKHELLTHLGTLAAPFSIAMDEWANECIKPYLKQIENLSEELKYNRGELNRLINALPEIKKEIAIGFAKYAMNNTFQDMNVLDLEGHPDTWEWQNKDGYTESITTEQLYQSYLNTLKQ